MKEAVSLCPEIAVNEMPYNIISRAIEAEILPYCEKHGIAVIASMTLQQGVLTGAYKSAEDVPPHQAHSRHFSQTRGGEHARHHEPGAEEEIFEIVALLRALADESGISMSQLSIAWALSNPCIASALVGSRNLAQLAENIDAEKFALPADIKARIDTASFNIWQKLGDNPDYYENTKNSRIY
jgi:aryl-alcohol dehydrogenase-like predicted oxidoreductase